MPKYIKAVDAADKFSEISGTPLCELVDIMCAIHAADVAEVVRGKWIRGGANDMHGFDFHCSECNKSFHLGSLATIYDVEREWIHCPSCGACMIGGEDDG